MNDKNDNSIIVVRKATHKKLSHLKTELGARSFDAVIAELLRRA